MSLRLSKVWLNARPIGKVNPIVLRNCPLSLTARQHSSFIVSLPSSPARPFHLVRGFQSQSIAAANSQTAAAPNASVAAAQTAEAATEAQASVLSGAPDVSGLPPIPQPVNGKKDASYYWALVKRKFAELKWGAKYLSFNAKQVRELEKLVKEKGHQLSYSERILVRDTKADIKRFVPFLLILIVLPEIIPLILLLAPNFIPKAFEMEHARVERLKKNAARDLADAVKLLTQEPSKLPPSLFNKIDVVEFLQKVGSSSTATELAVYLKKRAEQLIVTQLPSASSQPARTRHATLAYLRPLPREVVSLLSRRLNLSTPFFKPTSLMRASLMHYSNELIEFDKYLLHAVNAAPAAPKNQPAKKGTAPPPPPPSAEQQKLAHLASFLTPIELRNACAERGISCVDRSLDAMRRDLLEWIQMRSADAHSFVPLLAAHALVPSTQPQIPEVLIGLKSIVDSANAERDAEMAATASSTPSEATAAKEAPASK